MTALLFASLLVPATSGAIAADPPAYETRVLHDHDEDPALILAGKHGHDILALDVREVWDTLYDEPMLVFGLTVNGTGCDAVLGLTVDCEALEYAITFKAGAHEHNLTLETDDGVAWAGDGFDWIAAPVANPDGSTYVEAAIRFSDLDGVAPGTQLSGFFVYGSGPGLIEDRVPADAMPQGLFPGFPDPFGAAYDVGTYAVRNPDYYAALDIAPAQVDLSSATGVKTTIEYEITNPLEDDDISVMLDFLSASGLEARFKDGSSEVRTHTMVIPANSTDTYEFVVWATSAGIVRDLTMRMLTQIDGEDAGINHDSVSVSVDPLPTTTTTTQSVTSTVTQTVTSSSSSTQTSTSGTTDDESKDSPGAGLAIAGLAVLGAAAVLMRRRL